MGIGKIDSITHMTRITLKASLKHMMKIVSAMQSYLSGKLLRWHDEHCWVVHNFIDIVVNLTGMQAAAPLGGRTRHGDRHVANVCKRGECPRSTFHGDCSYKSFR